MIIGIGTDIVVVARIQGMVDRYGDRFLHRLFTERERLEVGRTGLCGQALAARFSAKEATMKALGTGYRQGVKFSEIEVWHEPSGKPHLRFHGATAAYAERLGVTAAHVTLTHDGGLAVATVVLEGEGSPLV